MSALAFPQSYYIPQINGVELPGTRVKHSEATTNNTMSVSLVILSSQIEEAEFYGLRNGGLAHPAFSYLHINSIEFNHDYPKEDPNNTGAIYNDACIRMTINYKSWNIPNQGFESSLENIGQVQTLPVRGLYWGNPGNAATANPLDPVWGSIDVYLRRGNLRITRSYTGKSNSPIFLQQYHNTVNASPVTLIEWGTTIPAGAGLFTVGNFNQQQVRDYTSSDPSASMVLYSYSFNIEWIAGGWDTYYHPYYLGLLPVYDRTGARLSPYATANWNLTGLG